MGKVLQKLVSWWKNKMNAGCFCLAHRHAVWSSGCGWTSGPGAEVGRCELRCEQEGAATFMGFFLAEAT